MYFAEIQIMQMEIRKLHIVLISLILSLILLVEYQIGDLSKPHVIRRMSHHVRDDCEQTTRSERILNVCSGQDWDAPIADNTFGFLVSHDAHRLMYCPIFSVASGTFRAFMMDAESDAALTNTTRLAEMYDDENRIKTWQKYSMNDIQYQLNNYFKFMVVRHPFDRLYSVYQSKFMSTSDRELAKRFTSLLRSHFGNKLELDASGTALPNLEQFLTMIVTEPSMFSSPHWLDYTSSCHPCALKYDHVIYMETFEEDIARLLGHLAYDTGSKLQLNIGNDERNQLHTLRDTSQVFKKVDTLIIDKLMVMYRRDFEVFGYTWSQSSGAGCSKCIC